MASTARRHRPSHPGRARRCDGTRAHRGAGALGRSASADADAWGEPRLLERCGTCSACARACPSGALGGGEVLLHAERCLTLANEDAAPFPPWVRPSWHECGIGCLRCQRVCPENARAGLRSTPPEAFGEMETAAILAADASRLSAGTRQKLERCGLGYSIDLVARNLRALLKL